MLRFNTNNKSFIENDDIDEFISEVRKVCKKHSMTFVLDPGTTVKVQIFNQQKFKDFNNCLVDDTGYCEP